MSVHVKLSTSVNGRPFDAEVEPRLLLVHFLRENLGLTGTHVGCDTTNCGACTVILDDKAVKSCTVLAVQADGKRVLTVEGLAENGKLDPVQEGFLAKHGLQCGYCTPGMLLVARSLLEENPNPSADEIKNAISGNICRCTGYASIIESVQQAARLKGSRTVRTAHSAKSR